MPERLKSVKTTKISAVWISLVLLCNFFFLTASPSSAASPIAVLKSGRNVLAYQDQHLGTFEENWHSIARTLGAANIRYDEVSDSEVAFGASRIGAYRLIVVPELVDVPPEVVSALVEFEHNGGKILISEGSGTPGDNARKLELLAGISSVRQATTTDKRKVVWLQPAIAPIEFPIGTVYSTFSMNDGAVTLANWSDSQGVTSPAVVKKNNSIYMSWSLAMQGELTSNATLLSSALDTLVPGISQQAAVQISFADYEAIQQELQYLTKRTEETIKTAKQADLAVSFQSIQQRYDSAVANVAKFQEAYKNRQFFEANEFLSQARLDFSMAFAQAMPVRPVEARAVWLDRGTIVSTRNPQGMANLFDRLKSAGINVVYFETNNAGFTMFPSRVGTQNPNTIGWDPLGAAVSEAHKRGMELHAWFWIFNVGNAKHNPIVGKPADYPGPVLSSHDFSWALESSDGSLLPPRQFEYWLDPSCPEAKRYIKDLIAEVIDKYPVEGVQLDYIRYPFNNKGSEMGFNWSGRMRFEQDTGLNLDHLDDETRQIWQAWKVQQVNTFVKDVSAMIRQTKPSLRISAAVYGMPKRLRLNAIQQEWETWVANGWVDTINPMTYVTNAKELTTVAGSVRESTSDQALVYPGLSIRQLDTAGLIEQLDSARIIGTLGTTMFAVAQLDDKKVDMLKDGPYRKPPILAPQAFPIEASQLLIDDFAASVYRYLQDPVKHIMSDQASTNEVLGQIEQIKKNMHDLTPTSSADNIQSVCKDVTGLHETIKNWLRLEAFIQRGFRAEYIVNYLAQVEAILSYASHKARCHAPPTTSVAGANIYLTPETTR